MAKESQKKINFGEEALRRLSFYGGMLQTLPCVPVKSLEDFAVYYTPGVARPCLDIKENPEKVYDFTRKWNLVAVVTDGTRVLGLGDIGAKAGLPVMWGKSFLFKYLGGVDSIPIALDTKNPEEIIQTVKLIQPTFGGINLEDISQPKCFHILDTLRKEMEIPVWHDDQQGTATVILAGLLNALEVVGKKLEKATIVFVGSGAASVATLRVAFAAGANPKNCIIVDSKGILHSGRKDIEEKQQDFSEKWKLCQITNPENRIGGIDEALRGTDVCIALSKPGPGVIQPEWLRGMNKDAILFACSNPTPEIWPDEAKEAGVKIMATGRSDFPNQVNNSLVFPAIFRGALDVRAKTITDEMCIAVAKTLANFSRKQGIDENHILATMGKIDVFVEEAVAVAVKAQEQGVARISRSSRELRENAENMIKDSQRAVKVLMKAKLIKRWY